MLITISGIDGSGKTTLANDLYDFLTHKGFNVKIIHHYNRKIYKATKAYRGHGNLLWCFIMYFVFLFDWIKCVVSKSIIIKDRWIYDSVVGWEMQNRMNSFLRFMYDTFPRADLSIITTASVSDLIARRPVQNINRILCNNKNAEYLKIANDNGFIIYNTSFENSIMFKTIIKKVIQKYDT